MIDTILNFIYAIIDGFSGGVSSLATRLVQGDATAKSFLVVAIYTSILASIVLFRKSILHILRRRLTVSVTYSDLKANPSEEIAFNEVLEKVLEASMNKRRFEVIRKITKTSKKTTDTLRFVLQEGSTWFFLQGRPVKATFTKLHKDVTTVRTLTLTGYLIPKDVLLGFFELKTTVENKTRYLYRFSPTLTDDTSNVYRNRIAIVEKNYFLPSRFRARLEEALAVYEQNRASNSEKGITNKLNVFIYGPPGTGKTVIAGIIAKMLEMNILVPLTTGDATLVHSSIQASNSNSVFLLDELEKHCVFGVGDIGDENENVDSLMSNTKHTLSRRLVQTLQVILDGPLTIDRQVVVMTTNHPELFSGAFLRSGRVTLKLEIGYYDYDDLKEWIGWYFSDAGDEEIMEAMKLVDKSFMFRPCDLGDLYTDSNGDFSLFAKELVKLSSAVGMSWDKDKENIH